MSNASVINAEKPAQALVSPFSAGDKVKVMVSLNVTFLELLLTYVVKCNFGFFVFQVMDSLLVFS